jgi:hypothetical protein
LNEVKNEIDDDPSYYPYNTLKIEILNTNSVVDSDLDDIPASPKSMRTGSKTSATTALKPKTKKIKFQLSKIEILNTNSEVNHEFVDPPASPTPIAIKTGSKTSTSTAIKRKTRKIKFQVSENGQYKCNLCPREFPNLELLRKHVRVHQRKKVICDDCGMVMAGSLNVSLTDI